MNPSNFSPNSPGRLVKVPEGAWAFIPDPLPPQVSLDLESIFLLDDASRALGELAGVGQMLPNPHLLIWPFMMREAVLSSRIEGTRTTVDQLLLFETTQQSDSVDAQEVANYVKALDFGLKRIETLPFSLRLTRELHRELLSGVRGGEGRPGEFRTSQNYIGQTGASIDSARFVPPPPKDMLTALYDFERHMNESWVYPPLMQIAIAHYQFEAIHPFADGNGRVGRLLIALQTCEKKRLPAPLLFISGYLESNRDEYMRHLLEVSRSASWKEWINFFLRGIASQSRDVTQRSKKLLSLRDSYRSRLQITQSSTSLLRLLDELFKSPYITVKAAAQAINTTYRGALLNIAKLQEAGILCEITGQSRNKVYGADEIIETIRT